MFIFGWVISLLFAVGITLGFYFIFNRGDSRPVFATILCGLVSLSCAIVWNIKVCSSPILYTLLAYLALVIALAVVYIIIKIMDGAYVEYDVIRVVARVSYLLLMIVGAAFFVIFFNNGLKQYEDSRLVGLSKEERRIKEIELQKEKIALQETIEQQNQEKIKQFRDNLQENKPIIIKTIIIIAIILAVVAVIILFVIFLHKRAVQQETIKLILAVSDKIYSKAGPDLSELQASIDFVAEYKQTIDNFNSDIRYANQRLSSSGLFEKGKIKNQINDLTQRLSAYEMQNEKDYLTCKNYLSKFTDVEIDTFINYTDEIKEDIRDIHEQYLREEAAAQERKKIALENEQRKQIAQIQQDRANENARNEQQIIENEISRAIKELTNSINILDQSVNSKKELSSMLLQQLIDFLDKIESNKQYLKEDNRKKIRRCEESFDVLCQKINTNDNMIKIKIKQIKDLFKSI